MNYRIEKSCDLEIKRIGDQDVMTISICERRLNDVGIGLCLLNEGLVSSLDLVSKDMRQVQLTSGDKVRFPKVKISEKKAIVEIDPVCLDTWTMFTLRAIRDGMAEVDHLDVEAKSFDGGSEVAIILKFPSSAASLSEIEIRKRLEL